jgi:hypothetical protein
MSAPKLTPWFPGYIKPVRPRVYRVYWAISSILARFDGTRWYSGHDNLRRAATMWVPADTAPVKWRGLAEQPK